MIAHGKVFVADTGGYCVYALGATTNDVARQVNRSVHAVYRSLTRIHDKLLRCINRTLAEERA